jgi:diguanylate cyclase (GGDEF)-like protein
VQSLRRLTVAGRAGAPVAVDTHTIPVVTNDGTALGAILLLHDASSEISLEKRCQNLHEKATKDPMTQVANRAEFDRVLEMFVNTHRQQRVPCSLIICDLDHFKQVNDNFGHPAGDEAIKTLATILKNSCRPGDLVARYGGEEFVLLCADCDNASATRRAEQVRKELARTEHPELGGRAVTASFGVTEIQPGDTAETMLRRADRGLLMAKAKGRNNVVQLGSGSQVDPWERAEESRSKRAARSKTTIQQSLITPVPIAVSIEKLRGFVADHKAQIEKIDGTCVKLIIEDPTRCKRRQADRPVPFSVELRFEEDRSQAPVAKTLSGGTISRTRILVTIRPTKSRDRRRTGVNDRARQVLASIRSYLMASLDKGLSRRDPSRHDVQISAPWPPRP